MLNIQAPYAPPGGDFLHYEDVLSAWATYKQSSYPSHVKFSLNNVL